MFYRRAIGGAPFEHSNPVEEGHVPREIRMDHRQVGGGERPELHDAEAGEHDQPSAEVVRGLDLRGFRQGSVRRTFQGDIFEDLHQNRLFYRVHVRGGGQEGAAGCGLDSGDDSLHRGRWLHHDVFGVCTTNSNYVIFCFNLYLQA